MLRMLTLFMSVLLLCCAPVYSQDWFVSEFCDSTLEVGTSLKPFCTIKALAPSVVGGDQVYIRGNINETEKVTLTLGHTSPMTLFTQWDSSGYTVTYPSSLNFGLRVQSSSNVTIEKGTWIGGERTFFLYKKIDNVIFRELTVLGNGGDGAILISGETGDTANFPANIQILDSHFEGHGHDTAGVAIALCDRTTNVDIAGNTFLNNTDAIMFVLSGGGHIVEENHISSTLEPEVYQEDGIDFKGRITSGAERESVGDWILVKNNVIERMKQNGINMSLQARDVIIEDNQILFSGSAGISMIQNIGEVHVTNNLLLGNVVYGVSMAYEIVGPLIFTGNTMTENALNAGFGMVMAGGTGNVFAYNSLLRNGIPTLDGKQFYVVPTLTGLNIHDNVYSGVEATSKPFYLDPMNVVKSIGAMQNEYNLAQDDRICETECP